MNRGGQWHRGSQGAGAPLGAAGRKARTASGVTVFALLLTAAASRVTVVDEVVRVPPGDVTLVNLSLRQRPAVVELSFEVVEGPSDIGVALMGPGDGSQPHQFLRVLSGRKSGAFRYPARTLGEYQVMVDNRRHDSAAVAVKLRVTLAFDEVGITRPGTLSPWRRAAVVGLSLLFFAAVVFWSGRRLLEAIEKRKRDERPPPF